MSILVSSAFLQNMDIFDGLPEAALAEIFQAAQAHRMEKDCFFFHQGDAADRLYVLTTGRVKMSQVTPDGQQIILRVIGQGEVFGGLALVDGQEYPASAEAVEESQALCWSTAALHMLMTRFPRLALNAIRWMGDHMRETQDRFRQMVTERVERRIARTLLRLARQVGRKVEDGVLVDFPLTRQDLAEMSGTTLFTVSRVLGQWEKHNLVKVGREKVVIRYPHGLVMIAEDTGPGT